MGLGRQLRDLGAITVAALWAGAAWAVGVRPTAAGALGLTVLTVKGLTGLALARPKETTDIASDESMNIVPDESIATPVVVAAVTAEPGGVTEGSDGRVFRREGEFWRIGSGEVVFYLRDSKGLRYLHCLLSNPGQEVLALQLAQEGERLGVPGQGAGLPESTFISGDDSLPVLDERAKAEYRERLRDLEAELEEAKALNNEGRGYRAELEIDALTRELLRASGIGDRDRSTPGQARRAANNVTRAIRDAIGRIAKHDASLAYHLQSTVHRGMFCRYDPGPGQRPNWRL
jgi:non-specific serine/threonine protein kinase